MDGHIDCEAQLMLLQMQVEQLQAEIEKEIEGHKKANKRASDTERRNKKLREDKAFMEEDLATAAYCWNCGNLGETEKCEKCAYNSVFVWNGDSFEWRGIPKKEGRAP